MSIAGAGQSVVVAQLAFSVWLPYRNPSDQRRLPVLGEAAHHLQIAFSVILEDRHRRFRPDDEVGRAAAEGHIAVEQQLHFQLLRVPFEALGDIALHGRNTDWGGLDAGPGVLADAQCAGPESNQGHQSRSQRGFLRQQARQLDEQGCRQDDHKAQQPDAAERSECGQWAFQLAVTEV